MDFGHQSPCRTSVSIRGGGAPSSPAVDRAPDRFAAWVRGLLLVTWALQSASGAMALPPATPLTSTNLQNAFRAGPALLSGSQPDGDAAFAELSGLGVRIILSVDGARPDIESAHRHGLRYVHLPFGYDGVPSDRIAELVQLARTASGAVYVHCHHGHHRGPTAVALMNLESGHWTPEQAEGFLHQAGTDPDYPGLYRSVRGFHPVSPSPSAASKPLPEVNDSGSEVEAMVALDGHLDRLKAAQRVGWVTPFGAGSIRSPLEQATLLWEQFRELQRNPATASRPPGYREKLSETERSAEILRDLLKADPASAPTGSREEALAALGRSCRECHHRYRD